MILASLEARGRAMRAWCDRVRERGDVALVEEEIDLPRLRAQWRAARAKAFRVCRLDQLGPTPIDSKRLDALRARIAKRAKGRRR